MILRYLPAVLTTAAIAVCSAGTVLVLGGHGGTAQHFAHDLPWIMGRTLHGLTALPAQALRRYW